MKFIHAADIHLDSPLRGLERYEGAPVQALRGATRKALENLVDLALEQAVAFVLIAGDLYDGDWKDYNTGLFFVRQMGRLQAADIDVYVVAGNHDAASQITRVLQPPKNVHLFATRAPESIVREDLGVAIHGQGFATRAITKDLTQAYPQAHTDLFNLGLLHTSLDGRPGHATYAPCSLDGLRTRGYDYWALGHVHRHEIISRDPWVIFPGNLQGRHIRESGIKGCCLVELDEGRVSSVTHYPLDLARWHDCAVDLTGACTLEDVYDRTGAALNAALAQADGRLLAVRLRLRGACSAHARIRAAREQVINNCRAIASTVGGEAIWIEQIRIATHHGQRASEALAREDVFGGLLRAIRDLELDAHQLETLGTEFADLTAKLPPELRTGDDPFDPTAPGFLSDCLEDAQALLLERLLAQAGAQEQ